MLPEVLGLSPAAGFLERPYQHFPSLSHKSPEASVEFAVGHGKSQ